MLPLAYCFWPSSFDCNGRKRFYHLQIPRLWCSSDALKGNILIKYRWQCIGYKEAVVLLLEQSMTLVRAGSHSCRVVPHEKCHHVQMRLEVELCVKCHSSLLMYHFVKYLPPTTHQLSNISLCSCTWFPSVGSPLFMNSCFKICRIVCFSCQKILYLCLLACSHRDNAF